MNKVDRYIDAINSQWINALCFSINNTELENNSLNLLNINRDNIKPDKIVVSYKDKLQFKLLKVLKRRMRRLSASSKLPIKKRKYVRRHFKVDSRWEGMCILDVWKKLKNS